MIASVRGLVLVRRPDHVVIESGGVGYRLAVSAETLRAVPAHGRETTLHAHMVVRDDSISLFGFATEEERDLFLRLISVSQIGPKVAVAILSSAAPRELVLAITSGDAKRFQAVPGIGKRTAERLIVELRDKLTGEVASGEGAIAGSGAADDPYMLARDGLLNLGYSLDEAERLLDGAPGDSAEALIQQALRRAAGASGTRG